MRMRRTICRATRLCPSEHSGEADQTDHAERRDPRGAVLTKTRPKREAPGDLQQRRAREDRECFHRDQADAGAIQLSRNAAVPAGPVISMVIAPMSASATIEKRRKRQQ
jgi:hypothetical protein